MVASRGPMEHSQDTQEGPGLRNKVLSFLKTINPDIRIFSTPLSGVPLRGPWPDEHCIYSSPRPILSRVPSLEQHQVPRPRPPDQGHDSMPRMRSLEQGQDQVPRSSRPPDLVEGQASPTPVLTSPSVLRESQVPTSNTITNQNVQNTTTNNNNNNMENRSNGKV